MNMSDTIKLAKMRQQKKLNQFKRANKSTFVSAKISKIPGQTYSGSVDTYFKKEIKISSTEAIHIIEKNGSFKSLICHVMQPSLEQLKRFGFIPAETPISQAINQLGGYRQIILKRAYENHKITSLHKEKVSLLDFSQDLLMALEPLECVTNTLNEHLYENQKIAIQSTIKNLLIKLSQYKAKHRSTLHPLCAFDTNALNKMDQLYEALCARLEALSVTIDNASFEELKVLLRPTGSESILTHVKDMGMAIIVKTQELNQNLTYSRKAKSFFRGELNNACEEALKVIQNYEADPHNPILLEHQGNFNDTGSTLAVDFSGLDEEKIKPLIYAINELSNHGIQKREEHYVLGKIELSPSNLSHKATWGNFSLANVFKDIFRGTLVVLKQAIFGVASFLINLIIDVPISFLTTLFSFDFLKISSLSTFLFPQKNQNSTIPLVKELLESCSFKQTSFGSNSGRKLALLAVNLLKDVGNTFLGILYRLGFGFYDLFLDAKIQFKKSNRTTQCQTILSDISDSLTAIKQENIKQLDSLITQEKSIIKAQKNCSQNTKPIVITSPDVACAPYHLSSGEWHDLVNVIFDKVKTILDEGVTFALAKHPIKTNLILALQLGAMLSILAPTAMPLVTQMYTQIFSLLQNTVITIIPQPVLNTATLIMNNDIVKYLQVTQMLENIIGINRPLGADLPIEKIDSFKSHLPEQNPRQNKTPQLFLQVKALQLLLTRQDVLQYLSYREKRLLMMVIEELFNDIRDKEYFIKGLSCLLYPPTKKTSLNQTLTIIFDYIPLLARCLLSPITFSSRPWHELKNKIIKDLTRIVHAISRLSNAVFNMAVRIFIRAPGDILVNEIAARVEGAIHDNKHSISQISYQLSQYCNQSMEQIRQKSSTSIDIMRRMSSAPSPQEALKNVTAYLYAGGLFASENNINSEQNTLSSNPSVNLRPNTGCIETF